MVEKVVLVFILLKYETYEGPTIFVPWTSVGVSQAILEYYILVSGLTFNPTNIWPNFHFVIKQKGKDRFPKALFKNPVDR